MRFLAILPLLAAAGCATPRVITSITMSDDQAKLLWSRDRTTETGIIQCNVQPDGTLADCKKIPITFEKKGGK
jgi:hypothetical protein